MVNLKKGSLKVKILMALKNVNKEVVLKEIYEMFSNEKPSTCRGRINEAVYQGFVQRTRRGAYRLIGEILATEDSVVVLLNKDGRRLEEFEDESIDLLFADHPWKDTKSNKGGNRNFDSTYAHTSFNYTQEDFDIKAKKLKEGCFLVEYLAEENANNFKYHFQIKEMAERAGLQYFVRIDWHKEGFKANTGRKSKDCEQIIIFSKSKARPLRLDKKKMLQNDGEKHYMSGAAEMLPTRFSYAPAKRNEKIHLAEKPILLYQKLVELLSKPGELVVDQFGGSCNVGVAILKSKRVGVIFEKVKEIYEKGLERIKTVAKTEAVINI